MGGTKDCSFCPEMCVHVMRCPLIINDSCIVIITGKNTTSGKIIVTINQFLVHVLSFQILANISKQGTNCLSDAHEYFNICYVSGLLPRNFDLSKPHDRTVSILCRKLCCDLVAAANKRQRGPVVG